MILRARAAFFAAGRVVRPGDIVSDSDPIVTGREALFETVTEPGVEEATARPGEKRSTTRPKKATKKATKKTTKKTTKKAAKKPAASS